MSGGWGNYWRAVYNCTAKAIEKEKLPTDKVIIDIFREIVILTNIDESFSAANSLESPSITLSLLIMLASCILIMNIEK